MTTREKTIRLGDALEELDDRLDELAEDLSGVESGTESAAAIRQEAHDVDTQGAGVASLIEAHGEDAEVTVRGLNGGEYARVEDRAAAMRAEASHSGGLPGSTRNVFAAAGLVDAPFLDEDAAFDERIQAVGNQPYGVPQWLEAQVNELTSVSEGNWRRLNERL